MTELLPVAERLRALRALNAEMNREIENLDYDIQDLLSRQRVARRAALDALLNMLAEELGEGEALWFTRKLHRMAAARFPDQWVKQAGAVDIDFNTEADLPSFFAEVAGADMRMDAARKDSGLSGAPDVTDVAARQRATAFAAGRAMHAALVNGGLRPISVWYTVEGMVAAEGEQRG